LAIAKFQLSGIEGDTDIGLSEKVKQLPLTPGVYLMKDSLGNVIYVGKAKQLKRRVQSYFQNSKAHPTKTKMLARNIRDLDYILTDTEFEAFMLECRLIKEIKPAYNSKMKNPMAYTHILVQVEGGLRRLAVSYTPGEEDSCLSFGPYTSRSTVERAVIGMKEFLRLMCSHPHTKGTPCLNHSLGLCLGICMGGEEAVTQYDSSMNRIIALLQGDETGLVEEMESRMLEEAERFDFEAAAKYRDYISAVRSLIQKERVIGFAEENKSIAVLEWTEEDLCKLILIKGNRVLFQEKYNCADNRKRAASRQMCAAIRRTFQSEFPAAPAQIGRYEVDEAQIIYSYLKSSTTGYAIVEEDWLSENHTALLEAVHDLLSRRPVETETAAGLEAPDIRLPEEEQLI
jgi:excinuclease ABC subunit C